ncbi:MAG: alkaline phosphatase [Fluviicola sp.]|nr:MAG: alkaline phosphatase [Fluviicola sp.]
MKRRDFFRNTSLATAGVAISPMLISANTPSQKQIDDLKKQAKNIIFLVSDGMSIGTLTMADLFLQRKYNKGSVWMENYKNGRFKRAMMDTASASSLVTDSAAGGSAWGGGVRVPNGSLNMSASGEAFEPILQKFKKAGKKVGCVTTVPITHATPASFCVTKKSRSLQPEIAEEYLKLKFDVMMGGGEEYFHPLKREDKRDLFAAFSENGFDVARNKSELKEFLSSENPLLGVFHESALPYTVDQSSDKKLQQLVPTIAEMTRIAIDKMKSNEDGFVLQVEGGKVDWAAHANDTGGLIYDQAAFDEAIQVALDFAEGRDDTLIIVTTDHGNGNPGLFYGKNADEQFDRIQTFKHSNDWILKGVTKDTTINQLIEIVEFAQGYNLSQEDAKTIIEHYGKLAEDDLTNDYKLPFEKLARIQKEYTSVGFGDMHHSADFVELAAFGPGSELLPPFVENVFLHNMMLQACGVASE